ncbi:MAG TPA: hypothetical protein VIS74_05730, partial [Chthoniobacterales bacterium]
EFSRFWAQTIRRLMRSDSLKRLPAELRPDKDGLKLTVDAVGPRGEFLNDTEGEAVVITPSNESLKLPLERTAPGRLEARWPAPRRGAYHVQFQLKSKGEPIASQYESFVRGYPNEFLPQLPNTELLRELSERTRGVYDPAPEQIYKLPPQSTAAERELWPWLVALALLLFIADVGVRRLSAISRFNPQILS